MSKPRLTRTKTQTLTIVPPAPFLNANQRLHWRRQVEAIRAWRSSTKEAAFDLEPYLAQVHVICAIRWPDNRRRDPGNWYPTAKAAVDGLVDAGVIADDDSTHLIGPDMRREYPNGSPRLTLTISEVGNAA